MSTMHFTRVISFALIWSCCLVQAANQHADDFSWVVGVNYVPSTAHNDVATWQDYDEVHVETELGYAAAAGFNAVRVFLHSLPWLFNASAFNARLAHFIVTAEALNLTSQLVLFDSCFGDVNADVSWITTGRYKNATWIPNPGPLAVANTSSWPLYDAYAINVLRIAGNSRAIFVWDIMNEPAFGDGPSVVDFIAHMSALVAANDAVGRPRTVGIASSSQQALVQEHVSMLSFHNYNGGGAGAALAQDIAGQQALGAQLGLPVLLTESMSRPADPLSGVLPAVYGCFNASSKAERIGWCVRPDFFLVQCGTNGVSCRRMSPPCACRFVWELMLGVDQFNNDWQSPYQGLVYPSWGSSGHVGGTFWAPSEQALLELYVDRGNSTSPCPPKPQNGSFIPDTGWNPNRI